VFKALALGATAVSVGKVLMPALAKDGAAGAQKTIEEITVELKRTMDLTGSADLSRINPAMIHRG
jgi:isopentenyl diphosphate isomerase/L-lactate dehydrogenase-like FMN-dependent dehydrogenase